MSYGVESEIVREWQKEHPGEYGKRLAEEMITSGRKRKVVDKVVRKIKKKRMGRLRKELQKLGERRMRLPKLKSKRLIIKLRKMEKGESRNVFLRPM